MHIALCSPSWPAAKHHNGIVTYVHWMKLELERLGHQVSVFTGASNDAPEPGIHRIERSWLERARGKLAARLGRPHNFVLDWGRVLAARMLQVHRATPIDIVEMEETFGWSADVARITALPVLVKLHGPSFLSMVEEELQTDFGRACVEREGWALARAQAIASPCEITLNQTLERYQLQPPIAAHVVNPVTLRDAAPRWSLDGCEPDTVLFVGRFDKRKGGDLVLDAFARLLQQRPTTKLYFAGPDRGLVSDSGAVVSFADYLAGCLPEPRRGHVTYLGPLSQPDVERWRVRALMTVVASRWENQGYTALEAMLQGCPVVCSDAGGCPELIEHGRSGLLFKSGDATDLAAQMTRMLDDRPAAARMGAQAQAFASQVHAAPRVAAQSLALYERVIANRAASPR